VTYDIRDCASASVRTSPAIMAKIKKAWETEKRIDGAQGRDMEFKFVPVVHVLIYLRRGLN
jgi:hypothetical protein